MVSRTALGALLLVFLSTQAHALCRDDLAEMKPRIDHVKTASPQRYALAIKWWGRAQEAEPGSEVECLNFLALARKALTQPVAEIANCAGPNAYLPNCQNGGTGMGPPPGIGAVGPTLPIGGGGGGGQGVAPVAPITQGGATTPFNPPGSVGSRSISPP
ncbi:MAG: hypothetical protein ACLQJR_35570 [Stellaceae bacterium]